MSQVCKWQMVGAKRKSHNLFSTPFSYTYLLRHTLQNILSVVMLIWKDFFTLLMNEVLLLFVSMMFVLCIYQPIRSIISSFQLGECWKSCRSGGQGKPFFTNANTNNKQNNPRARKALAPVGIWWGCWSPGTRGGLQQQEGAGLWNIIEQLLSCFDVRTFYHGADPCS